MCDPDCTHLRAAARHLTSVVNHHKWSSLYRNYSSDRRATTVLVCSSQPHAGDFLRAVPTHYHTTIDSDLMRICLQRRLALPLSPPPPPGRGLDIWGDALVNMGDCSARHHAALAQWADAAVHTYG